MAFSNNLSSLKLLENTYLENQAPLFYNSISYIEILNKRLEAKNTSNHSGSILNPYLLYGSGKIDVTNSLIRNNFPYLIRMENTFKLSSSVSLKLAQPSDLNLGSKLMAELQLEFKDLKGIPFIQAVMAKHNSVFVTVGLTISVQTWPKKTALFHWGQNTPSPSRPDVTPFDNTPFKWQMRNTEEEWKAIWAFLALEFDVSYRALQYMKLEGKGAEAAKLKPCYDFWFSRQLVVYFSHERDSLFRDNMYVKDWTLMGENPMLRELLEDNLYVQLNLLLAKRIIENSGNLSIEECIDAHYKEYAVGYNFLKELRLYNFNNYTSTVMLDSMPGGSF